MIKRIFKILVIILFTVSENAYSQWVLRNSNTTVMLSKVSFANANTGMVVGLAHNVFTTTNGGQTWNNVPNSLGSNLWGVQLINASTGFTVGEGVVIAKTTNLGQSWVIQSSPISENFWGCYFLNEQTGYVVGGTGTILYTSNSGANWISQTSNVSVALQKIYFKNVNTGIAVGNAGTILRTTNGGNNWNQVNSGVTSGLFSITMSSADTAYAGGEYGIILKSVNSGQNWIEQDSGTVARITDLYFANSNTGTSVSLGAKIRRTTNGGLNWITQNIPTTQDLWGVSFVSSDTGYAVGGNGTILRTNTGGFDPPSVPNLVSPINGAQNVSITPTLTWNSVPSPDYYNLQISPDSTFNTTLFDSTGITIPSYIVRPGLLANNITYYWRVRGHNIVGYGQWSQAWHFTTIVAVPNGPGLLIPSNNAANVSLHPFFDWDSTSPATYYELQAHYDSSFLPLPEVDENGITVSFFTLSSQTLRNNTRYFWRVKATNLAGTGPWSNLFQFSTIVTIPPAPILFLPANGAVDVSLTPLLKWLEDVSVIHYQTQISIDSNFASTVYDHSDLTNPQLTVPVGILNNFTKYYWRVRTTNSFGTGQWSQVWNFTTILSLPAAPVLLSPVNNAQNISLNPILDWDDNPYSTYRMQLSTDSVFSPSGILLNISPLSSSQYQVQPGTLVNNSIYYWRVDATNSQGTGPWSAVWHFTTIVSAPIAPPILLYPPNGSSGISLTPTLYWSTVFQASDYRLQLSSDSAFNSSLIDTGITNAQFTIPNGILTGSQKYFWRARAHNTGGYGPWSSIWNFTTGPIGIRSISNVIPKVFKLYYNFPNPFNPSTKIRFDLPENSKSKSRFISVKIIIYDIIGRIVARLYDGELMPGSYEILWNANNIASGIYFYRIITNENSDVKRMIYLK
jgi:photosystem II stability/assembly factor-like uncharacterized protein